MADLPLLALNPSRKRTASPPPNRSRKEVRAIDDPQTFKALIQRIIQELLKAPEGPLRFDPCGLTGLLSRDAFKRVNVKNAHWKKAMPQVMFVPQRTTTSGRTLARRLSTDVATQIARFYLATLKTIDNEVTRGLPTLHEARMRAMMRELQTQEARRLWQQFAEEGFNALVDSGISIPEGKALILEPSMQRANEDAYRARISVPHMDEHLYARSDQDGHYLPPFADALNFATSFCAQLVYDPLSQSADVVILDCGTVLYKGIPVLTASTIQDIARRLKREQAFAPCTDVEKIVESLAEDLNNASMAALKDYTDEDLLAIGVTKTTVPALAWVDAHQRTFHRSPVYSDFQWRDQNKPTETMARAVWERFRSLFFSRTNETSQMRFFCRLAVIEPLEQLINERRVSLSFRLGGAQQDNVFVSFQRFPFLV